MRFSFTNVVAVVTLFGHLTHAKDCTFANSTVIIWDPAGLSNIINCDTFPTSVQIASTFPGTFSLPNITNITGTLSVTHALGPSTLTSIVLDDLKYLGSLVLGEAIWNVDFISMGSLETVGDLVIFTNNYSTVRFPELKNAGQLTLDGNISVIDFSSLENASEILIHQPPLPQFYPVQMPAINLTFPALKNVDGMLITGNISEVSMPSLIGSNNTNYSVGIDIRSRSNLSAPINFASLTNTGGILLDLFCESLYVPNLANATSLAIDFALNGNTTVDFPALVNATAIDLYGGISDISLSKLQYLNTSLSLQTDVPFDCTPLRTIYDHTSTNFAAKYGYNSPAYNSRSFKCSEIANPYEDKKRGLSKAAKYGLGFGLGLGGGILMVLGLAWVLRWLETRKNKGKKGGKGVKSGEDGNSAATMSDAEVNGGEGGVMGHNTHEPEIRDNGLAEVSQAAA